MKKGKLISFEGIEGVGKTTTIKSIKLFLEEKGIQVYCTREPGGTKYGESLRSVLLNNKSIISIMEQLGVKEDQITENASFVDDLGADSLDTVELVMALEEEFDCEIPDEEAEKITTVAQANAYVQANSK